ncbi:MAG: ABC transporter ATP-binding protein [Oscillospiraceae bacterium]|jgi:iron complex transport system ATP-binding protein|nr:ABC transporter ATP-binding protein [Oscillospiraceae bacterium]
MNIAARKLSVGYDGRLVIPNLNTSIDGRGVTTFLGPNGCGKSTLLKALTRLLHSGGVIEIDGQSLREMPLKAVARKMSYLPQQRLAPPEISVEEFVSCGRMPHQGFMQRSTPKDSEIVIWAMEQTGVRFMSSRDVRELSGGEKQRVYIAAALAQQPEMLLLDEPTTYLDIQHQIELTELLRRLNRKLGMGIVLVLHDITQAYEISSEVVVMMEGRVYSHGAPSEVITPAMLRDVYGVNARVVPVEGRPFPLIAYDGLAASA